MSERIIIVGAGIAGLSTALALSRAGYEVTVLERDVAPPAGAPHALFATWERPGVPQFRHSHGFLACLRNLLRDRYPELLAALRQAGAQERHIGDSLPPVLAPSYTPGPGDDDLTALLCRRTTFEVVLQRYVRDQPRVQLHAGIQVTGILSTAEGGVPRLTGLTACATDRQIQLLGDIIIDATGRRSPFPAWLRALSILIEEETEPTGIIYYTRFYRLRQSSMEPERSDHSSMGDLGYVKFGVFPADNRTFSLTLAIPTVETDLRLLRHSEVFTRVCQALPALAPWTEPQRAEPLSSVLAMGELHSSYRRVVSQGQTKVLGYFAVGEAAVHTNPLYGRGCSLSFLHAHLLADVLRRVRDPVAQVVQFDAATHAQIRPFYTAAVRRDREGRERARQGVQSPHPLQWRARLMRAFVQHGLVPAMRGDLTVRRAFLRDFHMLDLPGTALWRPSIVLRIVRFWLRGPRRNANLYPPPAGPERSEMRRLLGLATP
jgi:2-polyprenyl-6-methoxyphenol hydroxylase-like FAD-dependent oxidoreductase